MSERVASLPERSKPDTETVQAVSAFMMRVEGQYSIARAVLYGSRARGTHKPDSDADLAVILRGERNRRWPVIREMSGIAFDIMLDSGILIQAVPLWESEWERPESFNNPSFIEAIKRDGLRLWPR